MGTSKKQKKRDGLRYREFVLSPYGVIKIKSLGYTYQEAAKAINVSLSAISRWVRALRLERQGALLNNLRY
ncbi:helix-turn-helix domain-containing protein [Symbiopectobacterium purcellii]|uniref:helix-turn-helix domain-containing protein n=1 Tax=Symbiopectobacterium purcellii TaxID=2871826 RepID=UPI003F83B542